MGSTDQASNLSVEELEALLLVKRRQLTEAVVRRLAYAERKVELVRSRARAHDPLTLRPVRSPETWRGDRGQDRYFRSSAWLPLEASRSGAGSFPTDRATGSSAHTRRSLGDRLLLAVEVIALVGFLGILSYSYLRMQALNREMREVQRASLVTPTAITIIVAAEPTEMAATEAPSVTPAPSVTARPTASATPSATATLAATATPEPTGRGAVPLMLLFMTRPAQGPTATMAASATPTPQPTVAAATPGPGMPRRVVIAAIQVDAPVVQGDSWQDLKQGLGLHPGSARPGEKGNVVISGHNDVYGAVFRDLDKLKAGDEVLVHTEDRVVRYLVERSEIVLPTQVEVMDQTEEPILTLITCYPYLLDTHRLVVIARLAE